MSAEGRSPFFLASSSLYGPVPGSSNNGACMQFTTGYPAVTKTAMSGAIWARCLVPQKLRVSSAAAKLIMATAAVKEAVALRIMATELRKGPWLPTPLY